MEKTCNGHEEKIDMKEIWKDVPGYEGYQVSNLGRVKSLNYHRTGKEGFLKPIMDCHGYSRVKLYSKGLFVHRLVWITFNGPIPDGMVINHKDECPSNNCLDNLMVCTQKENNNWGTHNERVGKSNTNNPKTSKWIIKLSMDGEILHFYPSMKEAERDTGMCCANIRKCCLGKRNHTSGFKWAYSD